MTKITIEQIDNAKDATEALELCAESLDEHVNALAVCLGLGGLDRTAHMIAAQVASYPLDGVRGIATIALLRLAKLRMEGKA